MAKGMIVRELPYALTLSWWIRAGGVAGQVTSIAPPLNVSMKYSAWADGVMAVSAKGIAMKRASAGAGLRNLMLPLLPPVQAGGRHCYPTFGSGTSKGNLD